MSRFVHYPDIALIGVPKSGTTSVHALLDAQPEVCGSRPKETFYFMDADNPLVNPQCHFGKPENNGYDRFFRHRKKNELTLDSTTHYFFQETALEQLSENGTKVCVILREPTARLVSYFQYVCQTRNAIIKDLCFGEFVRGLLDNDVERFRPYFVNEREFFSLQTSLVQGHYADYLGGWKAQMKSSNLLVLLFEDLIANQTQVLGRMFRFFGISYDGLELRLNRDNETYKTRFSGVDRIARVAAGLIRSERFKRRMKQVYVKFQRGGNVQDLGEQFPNEVGMIQEYYAEHNARLERLSGLDLGAWQRKRHCQRMANDE